MSSRAYLGIIQEVLSFLAGEDWADESQQMATHPQIYNICLPRNSNDQIGHYWNRWICLCLKRSARFSYVMKWPSPSYDLTVLAIWWFSSIGTEWEWKWMLCNVSWIMVLIWSKTDVQSIQIYGNQRYHNQCQLQQDHRLLHQAQNASGEFGALGALAAGVVDRADWEGGFLFFFFSSQHFSSSQSSDK